MNFTSESLQARLEDAERTEELRRRVFLGERDRVAGRAVAPGAPAVAGRAAADPGGRTAPFFVTFHPGGSWMST